MHWSEPIEVMRGASQHDQIYSMPVFRVGVTYLGLPAVFHKGDKTAADWDTVDTELAWSPDTISWNRVSTGQPLIPRGSGTYADGAYDCGCIYAAAPVLVGDKHHIYYGGSNGLHNGFREGSFCLATLPRDRFAGYAAPAGGSPAGDTGRLVTAPFVAGPGGIALNVDIAPGGRVEAALLGPDGTPITRFDRESSVRIEDGGLDVPLPWGRAISSLSGREVRLELELSGATVYAIGGDLQFTGGLS
jgi:hypothetical protein